MTNSRRAPEMCAADEPLDELPDEVNAEQQALLNADTPTLGIATLLDIFEGDAARVDEIFAAALSSIETDLARIGASLAALDMKTVAEAAHRMKGTSGSIRSQRIMAISAVIQDAAKREPHKLDAAILLDLGVAVAETRNDVEAFRRRSRDGQPTDERHHSASDR